jgi:putative tryptophan/tyrosine transport system substrate-binding protein
MMWPPRRRYLAAAAVLLIPLVAKAQPAKGRVYRVMGLNNSTPEATPVYAKALEDGFRELGYTVGKDLLIDHLFTGGRPERLPALAAEIVRRKPDVIIAVSNAETAALKAATTSIPIVIALGAGAAEAGLVASLAKPGGNITGHNTGASTEALAKQLELLREARPGLKRAAVLWDPTVPGFAPYIAGMEEGSRKLGIALRWVEVKHVDEIEAALATIASERVEALCVISNALTFTLRDRIAAFATSQRLPAISYMREFTEAGLLMSYGADLVHLYKRSAIYANKILKGAKPADLPVEQPTKYETVVNLRTAKALNLSIPQSLLLRADRLIE